MSVWLGVAKEGIIGKEHILTASNKLKSSLFVSGNGLGSRLLGVGCKLAKVR